MPEPVHRPLLLFLLLSLVSFPGTILAAREVFFTPESRFPVGDGPRAIATGHFNSDGFLDLVVVHSDPGQVSFLFGDGNGAFQRSPAGLDPVASWPPILTGRLNGDHRHDLVIGSSIFLSRFDGTYTRVTHPEIWNIHNLADFDLDGNLDLLHSNRAGGSYEILVSLGRGDGSFDPGIRLGFAPSAPFSSSTVDFNADGNEDFVIGFCHPLVGPSFSYQLGIGNGLFLPAKQIGLAGCPASFVAGDFNGDGFTDLAVRVSVNPGPIRFLSVYFGDGAGNFQPPASFEQDVFTSNVISGADFNADGRQDLVVVGSSTFSVYAGQRSGHFYISVYPITGIHPQRAAAGDFNRDGLPDLAVTNFTSDDLSVFLNDLHGDRDGDGVPNDGDNCPFLGTPDQADTDLDGFGDVCDNCVFHHNPFQEDADGDRTGDPCDPCTDLDRDGAGDPGFPANTCDLDNCPQIPNPFQEDGDRDQIGDVCDNCPGSFNPRQEDGDADGPGDACDPCTDIDGDGYGDPGFPANTCPPDNCPALSNPSQEDRDRDGVGDPCDSCNDSDRDGAGDPGFPADSCPLDNCPSVANFRQEDRNRDGSGDACQPFLSILELLQDGGEYIRARTVLFDPQGQPLSGEAVLQVSGDLRTIPNFLPGMDCSDLIPLDIGPGSAIGFLHHQGTGILFHSAVVGCPSGPATAFAPGRCGDPALIFSNHTIDLTGLNPPADICVRLQEDPAETQELTLDGFDDSFADFTLTHALSSPFEDDRIPPLDLATVATGDGARVSLVATDGETRPVREDREFVSTGESFLVFDLDAPPVASAGPDQVIRCGLPDGTFVLLDGTASEDPDSSPGAPDIVLFEWFEDLGLPTEALLGTGETLDISTSIGIHDISLRVTDTLGATSVDSTRIEVVDFTLSELGIEVILSPTELWPPNHRLVEVEAVVRVDDPCPVREIVLESIASNEPDEAPGDGDGNTREDIRGADVGTEDYSFQLRAERMAGGSGRIYTVTYRVTDIAGRTATASSTVIVSHEK